MLKAIQRGPFMSDAPASHHRWFAWIGLLLALSLGTAAWAEEPLSVAEQTRVLNRAHASVVGLRMQAVEDARSAATLGSERSGSGVVISQDGLVLTIGYLILEADHVELLLDGGRKMPARVVAYDVATGFGLVQSLVPLNLEPVPLGDATQLKLEQPMMVTSGGSDGDVSMAMLVSRRPFSGYWEYHIDSALFTAPPRMDHSGAGLFNQQGELVGIGSLLLSDTLGNAGGADHPKVPGNMFVPVDLLKPILAELKARGSSRNSSRAWLGLNCVEVGGQVHVVRLSADSDHPKVPGNMFVPVDLLKPILDEMRSSGTSHLSHRAWMGLNCVELDGQVRVLTVADDSPADVAGVEKGDRIVRIDGAEVYTLESLWKTLWQGGKSPEREVTLDVTRGDEARTLKLQAVDRMKTLRHAQGI